MDYKALADSLIQALRNSTQSSLNLIDNNRRNFTEDIRNRAAKRGTLYSSGSAAQETRYNATQYIPNRVKAESQQQSQEIAIKSDLIDTQNKITAMNKAAQELNGIDDNYFNSLLV